MSFKPLAPSLKQFSLALHGTRVRANVVHIAGSYSLATAIMLNLTRIHRGGSQMARNSQSQSSIKQRRAAQLVEIKRIFGSLSSQIREIHDTKTKKLQLLDSVSLGLYEEVDKLCKKAPAEPITSLVLAQVNDVIRETKQLAEDDSYIQRLNEFVAAGDNPEHRDAVVVLRQIRQGLQRLEESLKILARKLSSQRDEARIIYIALEIFAEGRSVVSEDDFSSYNTELPKSWRVGDYSDYSFNFEKLDRLDITNHFGSVE
jgi:hypothetical protein